MKTQSIKSIATLLGAAVVLNVSAVAGPGPQLHTISQVQERKVSDHQNVALVAPRQEEGKAVKRATESRSTAFYPGTHGGIAIR